ncbi:UvrD-helicase domain-containing protein [Methanomethylovorans sp.]|uniref:UvrD-helicase domain-containing protein n=1 Tax=Methanomethylovorans sp. TaxID=2758717 RepID=UPI00345E21B7
MTIEKIHGCPGTGKTTTLLHRFKGLLDDGYKAPEVTITSFRTTIVSELVSSFSGANVRSLHSLCNSLLGGGLSYMQPADYKDLGEKYGFEVRWDGKVDNYNDQNAGDPVSCYSWLRNTFTPPKEVYLYPGYDAISHIDMDDFITDYEEYKKQNGTLDYTDILTTVLENQIPLNTPVLMVDEYQDLTPLQDAIVQQWIKGTDKTIIAGDPAQSIYGVFGGRPELFQDFKADTNTVLDVSFRLYTPIWDLARDVLEIENQSTPTIQTRTPEHNTIHEIEHGDKPLTPQGTVLHLVRCNHQALDVALNLAESGQLFSGLGGWSKDEIRLFNTILKLRNGDPVDRFDLMVLLKFYPKHVTATLKDLKKYKITDKPPIKSGLIGIIRAPNPLEHAEGKINHLRVLKFRHALKQYKTKITPQDVNRIKVLTIHGAKGLEADTVFLHTYISKKIKQSIRIPGEDSEAEARVWYVGVTRARNELYLVKDRGYNYELPGVGM